MVATALGVGALLACNAIMLLRLLVDYRRLAAGFVLVTTVAFLMLDIEGAATFDVRFWPAVIVLMDLLLVIEADQRFQATVMGVALFSLSAVSVESAVRFGLYEWMRWGKNPEWADIYKCEDPPCRSDYRTVLASWVVPVAILLSDFNVTRNFALRLRSQLNVIDATVSVAEKVALLSAEYDIAEARRVVDEEGGALSEPLREAFVKLLTNLERYRAFLPAALLAEAKSAGAGPGPDVAGRTQLLPQLDSELTRNALRSVLYEATIHHRSQADAVMTEGVEACIAAGDMASALHLLGTGWDAPPALRERLDALVPSVDGPSEPSTEESMSNALVAVESGVLGISCSSTADGVPIAVHPARRASDLWLGISRRLSASLASSAPAGAAQEAVAAHGRFGDGADQPAGAVTRTELWPPGYLAPTANDTVHMLAQWHSPTGSTYWPSELVDQLIADFDLFYKDVAGPRRQQIALYVYTTEINHQVVWAGWQGSRWRRYADLDAADMAAPARLAEVGLMSSAARPLGTTTLLLNADDMSAIGMDTTGTCRVELMLDHEWGMRVYGTGGVPRLLRYENRKRGDPEVSPMNDTAFWAPCPSAIVAPDSVFSYSRPDCPPPPPGVFEFITSRDFRTTHAHRDWGSTPVTPECFAKLFGTCMAQKNQQRAKEKLCQLARNIFNSPPDDLVAFSGEAAELATALPVLYQTKCAADSPTPAQIAHACELGVLRWRGSHILVALTGEPRVAVPLNQQKGSPRAEALSRLNKEYETGQPYYLMNAAMRSQQNRDFDAVLTVRGKPFTFVAGQPSQPPAAPSAAVFVGSDMDFGCGATARWAGHGWAVAIADQPVHIESQGEVAMHAWGLPQYRALIWHIDVNLSEMPTGQSSDERSKGYRGLHNVTLDRNIYRRGNIVVFTAFTSTSTDQGVASGFATGCSAAVVFTMFTCTGRSISNWSRFGREKEVLLRPNTLHLVTEALSAEHAAIMDKEALQVFDLREVTTAGAVRHMAKEGALNVSREYPSVLRQAELAAVAAEKGNWVGALRELLAAPAYAATGAGEGRFVRSIMPRGTVGVIALVCSSPAGPELGAGIETGLWNDYFEQVEKCALAHHSNVTATPLGHIMVQITRDGAEATASAAVHLAEELVGAATTASSTSPPRSPALQASCGEASRMAASVSSVGVRLGAELFSPAASARRRSRRRSSHYVHGGESVLQVHCGVTVGTVHSGFGGSSQHRVEIADGPAVRRAFRMAAYSRRYSVKEIVTDVTCSAPAARAGCVVWTVDLVSFDSERDMREQLTCVEPRKCQDSGDHVAAHDASLIEEAWSALAAVAAGPSNATKLQRLRDCVAALPYTLANHRVARALQDAAEKPATYCCDLDALA